MLTHQNFIGNTGSKGLEIGSEKIETNSIKEKYRIMLLIIYN